MEINYTILLVGGVISMIVGSIWYGPLFGKKWMEIIGATALDEVRRKEMQKAAIPLYLIQFFLSLVQVYVLANLLEWGGWEENGIGVAIWLWLGFVMPTIAGSSMWNNNSNKVKWAQFLIQTGYQLVMFIIFGWLISTWG